MDLEDGQEAAKRSKCKWYWPRHRIVFIQVVKFNCFCCGSTLADVVEESHRECIQPRAKSVAYEWTAPRDSQELRLSTPEEIDRINFLRTKQIVHFIISPRKVNCAYSL